jgi:hypothetical protein
MSAAAPAPEFVSLDGDDLDTGLAQLCVGKLIPLIGDDDPRCESHDVVAVVPLLAFLFIRVATRRENAKPLEPQGLGGDPIAVFG